ncbi:N-acetylmuramoyl-L-alanine amidase [Streptomyces avermitilis]|uniref:N-acetylmuramoyl-L-alanine amidase n=1 Tax=Streptomyces avermitilis TaxID=33903 RepID=UPI0036904454
MQKPFPRAPAVRCLYRTACAAAAAALVVPLLVTGPSSDAQGAATTRLQRAFADAAAEYRVPQSVLLGVSYLQSRWDTHDGAPSVIGGYGPMHLTDTRTALAEAPHHGVIRDTAPPLAVAAGPQQPAPRLPGQLTTLERVAGLIGVPAARLRTDADANVRGGAALLAATQRQLGEPLSADPADWWSAVARFSGADDSATAATFANDVFAVIRTGAHRTTDTGQRVTLAASPGVRPDSRQVRAIRPRGTTNPDVECPATLACDWIPAPHTEFGDDQYGNHDLADRPKDQRVEYIVIHDTEATRTSMIDTVQDPSEASWHYTVRSSDGHITQHVKTKDVAWHSGSQFVNARSIGVEHEGFLTQPDAWYSEQMYRSSARLVAYLAKKYGVPLDRQHIFGHDNVPAPTASSIPDMHDDPGPFWDWRHYFDLLGAPLRATAGADSDLVTVLPDFRTNQPLYTGCNESGKPCAPHGSSAVRVHAEPDEDAPLIQDPGRRPDGEDSTADVNDLGSRISTGQTYAVAERRGDWTAIWYLGQKAWFKNPKRNPTAVGASGLMVTPKDGLRSVPVYGRAHPEEEAYPSEVPVQPDSPLPYELLEGQRYATQGRTSGSYFQPSATDAALNHVVKGEDLYYEIQFGHRIGFVRAADVDVVHADKR